MHSVSEYNYEGQRRLMHQITGKDLEALVAKVVGFVEAPNLGLDLPLDVREPSEFLSGHLHGAINIPLGQIAQAGVSLPRREPVVFMCRSGARSRRACALAQRAGVAEPLQLEGGLIAWQAAVEPSLHL